MIHDKPKGRLKFYCVECRKFVTCPRNTDIHISYMKGEVTYDKAMEIYKEAHYRHRHTNYDDLIKSIRKKYSRIGFTILEASILARDEARVCKLDLKQV